MAIYACSDLHGNWELWLEIKKFLKPEDKMFFWEMPQIEVIPVGPF